PGVHLHLAAAHLLLERLIGAEEQLLAGLPACVERARDLCTSERAVRQVTAVFARERHALRNALVDDVEADLGEAMDVGFTCAEVAALVRVVEQTEYADAARLLVLGGVNAALRGDAVRATRRILEAEAAEVVAQLC